MDTETLNNAMKQAFLLACNEECACVSTPEYAEYERKQYEELSNITDTGERMLRLIFYPFFSELYPDAEEFVSECLRCRILGIAEESLDENEVGLWRMEYRANRRMGGKKSEIPDNGEAVVTLAIEEAE